MNNKEVQLSKKGRLIVVTDLHGNIDDYRKYLKHWKSDDKNNHIVFAGDLIHNPYGYDGSVEIMDDVIQKTTEYENFHVLLGNHEWAHIINKSINKSNINQTESFEKLITSNNKSLQHTLDEYVEFFKTLPYFLKTDNGIFISHSGPSKKIKTIDDYYKIFDDNYNNPILYDFLWNRPDDYDQMDVENFLDIIDSNCMIIGHNHVNGFKKIGNQIIISSSFLCDNKIYFNINLEKKINDMDDLMNYMEFLE